MLFVITSLTRGELTMVMVAGNFMYKKQVYKKNPPYLAV